MGLYTSVLIWYILLHFFDLWIYLFLIETSVTSVTTSAVLTKVPVKTILIFGTDAACGAVSAVDTIIAWICCNLYKLYLLLFLLLFYHFWNNLCCIHQFTWRNCVNFWRSSYLCCCFWYSLLSLLSILVAVVVVVYNRIWCHSCHYFYCVYQGYWKNVSNVDTVDTHGHVSTVVSIGLYFLCNF